MKTIEINILTEIRGGTNDAVSAFCQGASAAAVVYQAGVWANIWNPVGWAAGGAMVAVAAGCVINEII